VKATTKGATDYVLGFEWDPLDSTYRAREPYFSLEIVSRDEGEGFEADEELADPFLT
jgi:hypothetical protein